MKSSRTLVGILLLISTTLLAQTSAEADALFSKREYSAALSAYETLHKRTPRSVLYQYRLARCYYELGESKKAIHFFEMAGDRYPLRNFYLGELYLESYRFTEAATAYETYLKTLSNTDDRIPHLQRQISKAHIGARFLLRVEDVAIVDSVSVRKQDFLSAYQLSQDAGKLTKSTTDNSPEVELITYTNQRDDRTYTSKHKDGKIGLYSSYKLLGEWSPLQPLSENINTQANENYPFMMPDGVTLFFASENEGGLGGYDIYMTKFNSNTNTYLPAENVGMPFNSPANDYMLAIDELAGIGWFATDRGQDSTMVTVYTFIPNQTTTVLRGVEQDTLRMRAQLKLFRKADRPQKVEIKTPMAETPKQEAFRFQMQGNLFYTQLSDFKNEEAKKLFEEYQKQSAEYSQKEQQLYQHRNSYQTANAEDRKRLTQSILSLESTLPVLANSIEKLRNNIRALEQGKPQ